MRFQAAIFSSAVLISVAFAQPDDALRESSASPSQSAREVALDNLLSERESAQALEAVIKSARESGIKEQAILEARFLYHVDRHEDDAIAAMLPEFLKQQSLFRIEDSAIFGVKEDWLAVTEYVQAIASLKKGDKSAFKLHITEAFWLSPRQASAFAPHIDRLRLEESMNAVKIDFEIRLLTLASGEAVSLASLMKDKKAMVLHFWSPASRECEASLPDFMATAKTLQPKGVAVVSLLPENNPDIVEKARVMIRPLGAEASGAWLVDQNGSPLARELRVQVLPVFVLLSNEGRVLFNGEPSDDELWDALKQINPEIARPQLTGPRE